jgi:hypothetical protein
MKSKFRFPLAMVVCLGLGQTMYLVAQQPASNLVANNTASIQTARSELPVGANLGEHPLKRPVDLANASLQQVRQTKDAAFILVKRERIKGKLSGFEAVQMKVREAPYSVYCQTLGPIQPKGREAIYVAGRNGGKAWVHVTGFQHKLLGTMSLDPNGNDMMDGNKYPMHTAGFVKMLENILTMYAAEAKFPAAESEVQIFQGAKVDGRSCTCVQVSHPVRRSEFPFQTSRVFYDDETNHPIRWEAYDWPAKPGDQPVLAEEYTYRNIQLNPGLGDKDFDPKNPAYGYN